MNTMIKYTKKPVTIEAIQLTKDNFEEVKAFVNHKACVEHYNNEQDFVRKVNPVGLHVETLEGTMLAKIGDYIIKGIKGEFYPCKPDIFELTYTKEDSTFLDRLIKEEEELGLKIVGLNKALNLEGFQDIAGTYQYELLNVQHSAMITYRRVLNMRINDLKTK